MSSDNRQEEVSLINYLQILVRHKWLILIVFILVILAVGGFTLAQPQSYRAQALVSVGQVGGQLIQSEKASLAFLNNHPEVKALGDNISVESEKEGYFSFELKAASKEKAEAALARVIAIFIEDHQQIFEEYQPEIEQLKQQRQLLEDHFNALEDEIAGVKKDIVKFRSPYNQTQAITLQAYLDRLSALEQQKLAAGTALLVETKQLNSQMTELKGKIKVLSVHRGSLKRNLAMAVILGLFLAVIVAFGREWWQKNKIRLKINKRF